MEKKPDELKPIDAEAARLYACGKSQSEAYRLTHPGSRAKPEAIRVSASRLFDKASVKLRVQELIDAARIHDIETVGQAYRQLLEDMQTARDKGNDTALASYTKTKFQAQGIMRETVLVGAEKSESDDELIARLSGGDPHKATMLRAIIGKDSFGDGEKDDEGEG